jgi:MFS family permease
VSHSDPVNPPRTSSTRALLLVVCLAQFMVILDVAVVNVALPSMRDSLGFSTGGLQWVVNAYTLTFAGFMMLGGRIADLLGRRRVLRAGAALFALSSLLCALADSRGLLIGARALQGLGGAIVSPATLSIITSALPEGRERNRGLAAWAAVASLGASSGALLGGVLTQALGWPAIFAVNVPLGALIVLLAARVIPADRATRSGHFDLAGAALVTGGLVSLTYGIVRSTALGWGAAGVLGPLEESGVRGAKLLLGALAGAPRAAQRLDLRLVVRATTGPPSHAPAGTPAPSDRHDGIVRPRHPDEGESSCQDVLQH